MTNLYEVIYISKRADDLSDNEIIDDIVLPAGLKNRRLDISGCLWFTRDKFIQILEGPRESVESVYNAIQGDHRHTDINTISSSPITNRSFKRWGMRAVQGNEVESIQSIIDKHASGKRPDTHIDQTEQRDQSLLDQIRQYLVTLAVAEPAAE